jgi:hypothetical protein
MGGAAGGYLLYRKATGPKLESPTASVDNYLYEFLVARNDIRAKQYVCGSPDLADLASLRKNIEDRERTFGISIAISWGPLTVSQSRQAATVGVDLTIRAPESNGSTSSLVQPWRFSLTNDAGWRVCGAHQVGT